MTGDVAEVTFDNVKYGQNRAAGNADLPLAATGGASLRLGFRLRAARFGLHRGPASPKAGPAGRLSPRNARQARSIPGCSAMEAKPLAAACATVFPM